MQQLSGLDEYVAELPLSRRQHGHLTQGIANIRQAVDGLNRRLEEAMAKIQEFEEAAAKKPAKRKAGNR